MKIEEQRTRDSVLIYIDDTLMFEHYMNDEDRLEDNEDSAFWVPQLLEIAYNAGKNGEPFDYTLITDY